MVAVVESDGSTVPRTATVKHADDEMRVISIEQALSSNGRGDG